jgi:hypothetical protein
MHWKIHLLKAFAEFLRHNDSNAMWREAADAYDRIAEAGSESELVEAVNALTSDIGRAITRYART